MAGPMWTCPECGRSFANKNQWHACQTTTVSEALAGKSDLAVSIYERVVAVLETAGEFRIHPQRSKIAFISRMTFAGVSLARRWVDLSFILPRALDNHRIRRLELYGPTSWGHQVRLEGPGEVDHQLGQWLAASLTRGDQKTLDSSAEVRPLTMSQLEVFWTGFTASVHSDEQRLWVELPGYVAEALTLIDEVLARVGGSGFPAAIIRDEAGHSRLALDPGLGLGEGDRTDVFLEIG